MMVVSWQNPISNTGYTCKGGFDLGKVQLRTFFLLCTNHEGNAGWPMHTTHACLSAHLQHVLRRRCWKKTFMPLFRSFGHGIRHTEKDPVVPEETVPEQGWWIIVPQLWTQRSSGDQSREELKQVDTDAVPTCRRDECRVQKPGNFHITLPIPASMRGARQPTSCKSRIVHLHMRYHEIDNDWHGSPGIFRHENKKLHHVAPRNPKGTQLNFAYVAATSSSNGFLNMAGIQGDEQKFLGSQTICQLPKGPTGKHAHTFEAAKMPKGTFSRFSCKFCGGQPHAESYHLGVVAMCILCNHEGPIAIVCFDTCIKQFPNVEKVGVTIALLLLPRQKLYIPARPPWSQAFHHTAEHHLSQVFLRRVFSMISQPKPRVFRICATNKHWLFKAIQNLIFAQETLGEFKRLKRQ